MKGQEDSARKMITEAILNGHWLMLQVHILSLSKCASEQSFQNVHQYKIVFFKQNCHLCLDFCEEIITTVVDTEDMHRNFR